MSNRLVRSLAVLALVAAPLAASSHREAPGITELPKVDGTDFYMFRSYEPGRAEYVTLLANYLPIQAAYGGPNFFTLDPDARYRILIDSTGDGVEDLTFQFRVTQRLSDIKLNVGGQQVSVPLINVGNVTDTPQNRSGNLNVAESYTMAVIRGPLNRPNSVTFAAPPGGGAARFGKPVDNIGQASIPDYATYAQGYVQAFAMPGCSGAEGRVFVGQRAEPFAVNLGEIFDLVNIANPLGPRDAEPNILKYANITTFAVEVPSRCLTGSGPVIGGWTTSALPRLRTLTGNPSFATPTVEIGDFVQVSRLGMPLVNEVVIGLKDKNLFNAATPKGDAALATYVTNPTLPEILELLFGAAGVRAPNNFPRTDLVAAFATGVQGLNFLSDGAPHEMQRLNTSIAATPSASQNNLGVLGGDNAGFPNGRRPGDDVVDIELRVAMGVLCHAFPGVFCTPADAPSGNLPFTDGTLQDASQFDSTFPYLKSPTPGSPNGPNGVS